MNKKQARLLIVLAAAAILFPRPSLAVETASLATPLRAVQSELTDFKLCELNRKTEAPLSECIPAKVPGDIVTDLWRAGRIADPYVDMNSKDVQWVDDRAWRYETTFTMKPTPGRREHLLFMGIDYISRIELNGKVLAKHEGMFSRVDLDITDALDPSGSQKLAVVIFGINSPDWSSLGKLLGSNEFGRKKYLKTQMSFDWDFAPRLKGGGIWDRVFLYETGPVAIKDVNIIPDLDGEIVITVGVGVIGNLDENFNVHHAGSVVVTDPSGVETSTPMRVVIKEGSFNFPTGGLMARTKIDNPQLWWPWDMGKQNLYTARVQIKVGDAVSDEVTETFGIREITWGPNPDAPAGSADWVLFVNGQREFMRGANWVPPEAMYGRMDDGRYGKIVGLAKGAGVNLLRIWGGGNRERRAFYDECDRAGVMVWQEFPFACVFLTGYPHSKHFQDLTRQESEEIVRQLRNHPALIQWCGGNEFNVKQNAHVVKIMRETTAALDTTRRFIPASPYKGDTHNWVVWHMQGNLDDYFRDGAPFPSEFGLQAFPAVATLKKYFSPEALWPIGPTYVHHDLGEAKMMKYASVLKPDDNLDSLVNASQLMQAHFLQRGIENWRQRKYQTSGTAFWQLNEPWPAISWAVLDYDLVPKLAYNVMKNTYNPVLVTARYQERAWAPGDDFSAEIMVVNDRHQSFPATKVSASLCGLPEKTWSLDVPEDAVASAGRFELKIPLDCAKPELKLRLEHAEAKSENLYHLWIFDPKPAPQMNRTIERLGKFLMSGAMPPKAEKQPETRQ